MQFIHIIQRATTFYLAFSFYSEFILNNNKKIAINNFSIVFFSILWKKGIVGLRKGCEI